MNDIKVGDFVRVKNIPAWLNVAAQGLNVFKVEEIVALGQEAATILSIKNPDHMATMFLINLERINKFRPGDSVRRRKEYFYPGSKRKILKVYNIAYSIESGEVNIHTKDGFYHREVKLMLKKRGK